MFLFSGIHKESRRETKAIHRKWITITNHLMVINHPRFTSHYETWPLALPTMPCFYSCWRANSIFCLGRILTEASFTAISMWECWAFIPLLCKRYKHGIGGHFRSASKPAAEVGTKRHWRLCTQCKPAWQDRDVTFWRHVMCANIFHFFSNVFQRPLIEYMVQDWN